MVFRDGRSELSPTLEHCHKYALLMTQAVYTYRTQTGPPVAGLYAGVVVGL